MGRNWMAIGMSLLAVYMLAGSAFAQGSITEGYQIATETCSECHAVESDEPISPNLNAPTFREVAEKPGINALSLSVWFRTPHPTMPNFVFNADETEDLIAYIMSLKGR